MESAGGMQKRVSWAGLALLVLLPVAAALAGCKGDGGGEERVEMQQPQMVPPRGKDYWIEALDKDAKAWVTLDAPCDVTIRNPRINTTGNVVPFTGGRLVIKRPDSVYLRVPDGNNPRLLLKGDGKAYRADLRAFGTAYSGNYDDAIGSQTGPIHFMPADVAHAFCPRPLLDQRAPALTEWARLSKLSAVWWVEGTADFLVTATITFDRATGGLSAVETYDNQGTIRSSITYPRWSTLDTELGQSVRIPTGVLIDYQIEQTLVLISLRERDVKLNAPIKEEEKDLFTVTP
jgi:hypothetical protein